MNVDENGVGDTNLERLASNASSPAQMLEAYASPVTYTFGPDQTPEEEAAENNARIPADMVPDFRNLRNKRAGLQTELGTSNVNDIKEALSAAQQKPVLRGDKKARRASVKSMPRSPSAPGFPSLSSKIPEWYRVGWTAFSNEPNPGGPSLLAASEKKPDDPMSRAASILLYAHHWQGRGPIFAIGIMFWLFAVCGGGFMTLSIGLLVVATYYQTSTQRFKRHARDDIERELKSTDNDKTEAVDWLNSFLQRFWLILEPVVSAYVMENIDTYLVDYLPGFLDAVRLTTFTLGTKSFQVNSVHNVPESSPDTVCMIWQVSFRPDDTTGMSKRQLETKVNPKVLLTVRLGKGMVGAGIPILVEDMSFSGKLRVRLQFMSKSPHVKMVEASFMGKPQFDYVLKPIGGETFGFDVTNIPGFQSIVRDQVHAILGPMMYHPHVFSFDVEKFFSGELDISQANGVLAVTVYAATPINAKDFSGSISPYIRFYLDKAQELGRTSVQMNALEPRWNETHFLLLNNLTSKLSFEMRNQQSGSKDRRIARAHFDLSELSEDDDYSIQGLHLDLLHNKRPVSQLEVDMRYMAVSRPVALDDGTVIPAVESNSGILRFTVHECRNLGSQRVSPYAVVMVNGAERMKTPVFKRNPNPKFERPCEVVVLDQTAVHIRVEVRDSVSFAEDPMLGIWVGYLANMIEELEANDGWFDLINRGKRGGRIRMGVQWKPVVMSGLSDGMGGQGYYTSPIGVVRLTFWEARDLKNVEGVASKSDPYVRVLSGSQVRARTEVIDNNLNPQWGETTYVPVHSAKEDLILEVMDWNAKTKDKSLGSTILRMKDLVQQRTQGEGDEEEKWYAPTGQTVDLWAPLRSSDRKSTKGELRYTATFHPTPALPEHSQEEGASEPIARDLNGYLIRYTPDDLTDLLSYNSGILTVKIHEVKFPRRQHAFCQLLVDSLMPQFQTTKMKGRTLPFNQTSDAFVKESDFSRVAIEVKPEDSDEKDDLKVGYWVQPVRSIIRQIQARRREEQSGKEVEYDGEWFQLLGTADPDSWIRLSFDYHPLINFTLNPDESLENQGQLKVTLVNGRNLMAADKSGTSDPYVVFTVNGERVYKSAVIKKTLNPVWQNEQFTVPIQSRVNASFRIEVFDWNKIQGDIHLGSGGVSLRGDFVESMVSRQLQIPLDGVSGVSGYITVRLLWEPQLLVRKKTHTSVLGNTRIQTNMPEQTPLSPTAKPGASLLSPATAANPHHTAPPNAHQRNVSIGSELSVQGDKTRRSMESASILEEKLSHMGTGTASGQDGMLIVHLLEARNLRGVDKGGTSDPFVRLRVGKSHVFKSRVIKKTLFPEWKETFRCNVQAQPTMLDVKVKDYNRFSPSVELGQFQWNLWDLLQPPHIMVVDKWLPLFPAGQGEIRIKLEFTPR